MQWEACVKRDLERVGGEWRTTAKDRRSRRLLIENVTGVSGIGPVYVSDWKMAMALNTQIKRNDIVDCEHCRWPT